MVPHQVHSIYADNRSIAVHEWNVDATSQPPILFIHGWGISPVSYEGFLDLLAFSSGRRILAPALPGFGGSDILNVPTSFAALTEHVVTAVNELDLEDGTVVSGHSLGGALAIRVAAEGVLPEFPVLVAVSPAGIPHHTERKGLLGQFSDVVSMAVDLRHEIPHDPLKRIADSGSVVVRHPGVFLRSGFSAALADVRPDIEKLLSQGSDVALIIADRDRVTPYEAARKTSGVRILEVSGTHGWILSQPEEAVPVFMHTAGLPHTLPA